MLCMLISIYICTNIYVVFVCLYDGVTNIHANSISNDFTILTLRLSYIENRHKLNFILLMSPLVKAIILL